MSRRRITSNLINPNSVLQRREMGRPNLKTLFSLDNYLDFFDSRCDRSRFSLDYINQIISMHGFKKLHQVTKNVVIEAVNTIDLMEPSRSTVGRGGIDGGASRLLTTNEATSDLKELKCQECPRCQVISVVRLSASRETTMEREISKCSKNDDNAKVKMSVKGKKRESKDSGAAASRKKKASGGKCLDTSAIGTEVILAGNVDLVA